PILTPALTSDRITALLARTNAPTRYGLGIGLLRGGFDDDAVDRRGGRNRELLHRTLRALLKEVLRVRRLQPLGAVPLCDIDQLEPRVRIERAVQPQRPETWLPAQEIGAFAPLLHEPFDVVRADLEDVDERDRSAVWGFVRHTYSF